MSRVLSGWLAEIKASQGVKTLLCEGEPIAHARRAGCWTPKNAFSSEPRFTPLSRLRIDSFFTFMHVCR